jgi:Flp pilus assembly protein TadD
MNICFLPKFIFITIFTLCVFCFDGLLFAREELNSRLNKETSGALLDQSRKYREEGLENQRIGNLPAAMNLYQKAIALDPAYAAAYNDLGVIYEAAGFPEQAKESYLKAIQVDPAYLSAYTNIAFIYEEQRDLKSAAFYWAKRAEMGSLDDLWTLKASSRLKDIRTVLSSSPVADARETEVLSLVKDVVKYKSTLNKNDKALAQDRFDKAKQSFNKGDLAAAIKEALDAEYLDPDNPEIEAFIEKTELRALSR